MPDDSPDVPGDAQDQPPDEVTCAGGITIPAIGVSDGPADDQE